MTVMETTAIARSHWMFRWHVYLTDFAGDANRFTHGLVVLQVLQFEICCKVHMKRCLQPFIPVLSCKFVAILCFGKLVDNSYGFVQFLFIYFHTTFYG